MDKGQHLRLVLIDESTNMFIALATELTLHLSASTENSTTKDSTDTDGMWQEYEVSQRNGDIQFGALIGVGTDSSGVSLDTMIYLVRDEPVNWKIVMTSGANNRVVGKTICSGQGKLTSLNPQGQNRQNATYSGTLNIYGPVTVGND